MQANTIFTRFEAYGDRTEPPKTLWCERGFSLTRAITKHLFLAFGAHRRPSVVQICKARRRRLSPSARSPAFEPLDAHASVFALRVKRKDSSHFRASCYTFGIIGLPGAASPTLPIRGNKQQRQPARLTHVVHQTHTHDEWAESRTLQLLSLCYGLPSRRTNFRSCHGKTLRR